MITLQCPKCLHTVRVIGGDAFHQCPKGSQRKDAAPTQYVRIDDKEPSTCR